MTTWNYIIGNEKDFEGAPDWATKRIKGEWSGKQSFCGLRDRHVHICNIGETMGEKMNMGYAHTVIAQREPVAINDNRPRRKLRPRSIHHPDGTVQFGCIQTPLIDVDMVNHPSHYTQGSIECIDAIKAATVGKTGIEAVCVANVIKYLWRYEEKNGLEDVKKARWYLERLISELSESE